MPTKKPTVHLIGGPCDGELVSYQGKDKIVVPILLNSLPPGRRVTITRWHTYAVEKAKKSGWVGRYVGVEK